MTTKAEATTREITLPVTGMTCASCVRRIEKALGRVEGVDQANVNLATEKATVRYDPSVATPAQMQAAVEKAGYAVREIPSVPAATELTADPAEDPHEIERQHELDDLKR